MKNKLNFIRNFILFVMLILIFVISFLHTKLGSSIIPSVHALCPYGAIESLYSIIFSGTYIKKIFLGTFVLLGLTTILTILFRRAFCGYICPFGAVQEFFGMIGRKIFKKQLVINKKVDNLLRWLKYVVLVLTAVLAWQTSTLWFSAYDPYSSMVHIFNIEELVAESLIGLIILLIIIIGSILYDRFFCKYLCPAGAMYGILSKIGLSNIKRDKDTCINCKKCSKVCPMNIEVDNIEEVKTSECINCNKCVNVCPKKGALEIKTINNKKISVLIYIILVLGIFFGGILIANLNGIYIVKNDTIKSGGLVIEDNQNVSDRNEPITNKYDVSLIKGSTTLNELIVGMNTSKEELYELLEIDESIPTNIKIKELQNYVTELTPGEVRSKIDPSYVEE